MIFFQKSATILSPLNNLNDISNDAEARLLCFVETDLVGNAKRRV